MVGIYIFFLCQCVLYSTDAKSNCGYKRLDDLVQDEGENIESNTMNYNNCANKCTETKECNSFSWCAALGSWETRCHLKKKVVDKRASDRLAELGRGVLPSYAS